MTSIPVDIPEYVQQPIAAHTKERELLQGQIDLLLAQYIDRSLVIAR